MVAVDRDALIRFTQDLVSRPSVLGDENGVAERVLAEMRYLGYDHVEIDEAGNAVGLIRGHAAGPTVVLDAHMDTVDVVPRDAWTHDPFGGEIVDGRMYGRGTSDMKGALAGMVHGCAAIDRSRIRGTVVVSGSVGEELVEGVALRAVMQRHGADYVIIGEASELDIVRAGRGRAEFVVKTFGTPSHASTPTQGVNAVHKMRRVIDEIEALPMPTHEFVGSGVMCLTDIISIPHPAHSVVPSGCRATYERRTLPGENREDVLEAMLEACRRADAADSEVVFANTDYTSYTGVHWRQPKWFPAWEFGEEHEVVGDAQDALEAIGQTPAMRSYQFCTNAAYSAGEAGIPTIGYGPSRENLAHVIDEYIELEQLEAASNGYGAIVRALLA